MFVDASVMVAILLQEPGGERLAATIDALPSSPLVTNVIAVSSRKTRRFRIASAPLQGLVS